MLIAILVVVILGFIITFGMLKRLDTIEATLDEIKSQTDKLGTHEYK